MRHIIQEIKTIAKKFNIFDYLVLSLVLIALAFLAYQRLQRQSTWVNVRLSVENLDWWYGSGQPPQYWYAAELQAGDQILNSTGEPVVEIVDIENYDDGGPYRLIYVDLKMKVDCNKMTQQYLYEFKPLVAGGSLVLNFPQQQLRGLVVSVGEVGPVYVDQTVRVEVKEVPAEVAELVMVGSQAFGRDGELVAEIIDLQSSLASEYEFSDIRGQKIETFDPDYRDLQVTLRVRSFETLDRQFYVNGAVLKAGAEIWFQFPDFALEEATIVAVGDN